MKKILFTISLALSMIACKKSQLNTPELPPPSSQQQLKRPLGTPLGNAVTKEIGTIQSTDGVMKVSIPAGAVVQSVTFSIQEIKNTLGAKATLYHFDYCGKGNPKSISGKSRIKRTS